jgi:HAD superfamily hydrolase (TIGR01490 family)
MIPCPFHQTAIMDTLINNHNAGRVAAIFDVDWTLVRGLTERLFFRFLLRRRHLPLRQALPYLARLLVDPQRRFRDKTYLRGFTLAEVAAWARACFAADILPKVSPVGLDCLEQHRRQGDAIILVTGTLAVLAEPLQELVAADWLIATHLAEGGGRLTGGINGLNPRGENKAILMTALAREHGLDLARSFSYGDSKEDVPILKLVAHPVAVNPCRQLKEVARRQGWPIYAF